MTRVITRAFTRAMTRVMTRVMIRVGAVLSEICKPAPKGSVMGLWGYGHGVTQGTDRNAIPVITEFIPCPTYSISPGSADRREGMMGIIEIHSPIPINATSPSCNSSIPFNALMNCILDARDNYSPQSG